MDTIRIKGKFTGNRNIELESKKTVDWNLFGIETLPNIPLGSTIELLIAFDEHEFISGKNGFVWATYDLRQAQIIRNALITLQINTEITKQNYSNTNIYLIRTTNEKEIDEAVDFIWKGVSGLRLKPDWKYPLGETNKSFEKWLSGQ